PPTSPTSRSSMSYTLPHRAASVTTAALATVILFGGQSACQAGSPSPPATPGAQSGQEIKFAEALVIASGSRYGRAPLPVDALAAQLVVGTWTAPKEGSELKLPDGSLRKWEAA